MDEAEKGRIHSEILELWKQSTANKDSVSAVTSRLNVLEERVTSGRELFNEKFNNLDEHLDDLAERLLGMQRWLFGFLVTIISLLAAVLVALIGGS